MTVKAIYENDVFKPREPAPRRARSCPRAVRQPVTGWPRLFRPESIEAPWQLQIV
jgi:hypothetical protein